MWVAVLAIAYVLWHVYRAWRHTRPIQIKDRLTQRYVTEITPFSDRIQLYLLFGLPLGRWVARQSFLRNYLRSKAAKSKIKYDAPSSRARIPSYITDYGIDTSDVADSIDSFACLNAFFYRHLKPDARPLPAGASSGSGDEKVMGGDRADGTVIVSPADCRMLAFPMIQRARMWIKGDEFTIPELLGARGTHSAHPSYEPLADAANAICRPETTRVVLCRLAPTDYHRFHSPCDGIIAGSYTIGVDLYSVKPVAVCTDVNVFTDNKRTVLFILSPIFGVVVYVMVGATDVGSINITARLGSSIRAGDEIGYFAYGGSQLVVLFPNLSATAAAAEQSADAIARLHTAIEKAFPAVPLPRVVAAGAELTYSPDLLLESVAGEMLVRVRTEIGRANDPSRRA